jgi:hypothetical protein
MITAPAANRRPPSAKAAMIMPMLAPVDRPCFEQVVLSAIAPAEAVPVPVTFSVEVMVAVGVVDVVSGTLVVVSVISIENPLQAAIM